MEWIENLNRTIDYIEDNLEEEIDYNELARIACCSTYHFQRMFTYMSGVSLAAFYPFQSKDVLLPVRPCLDQLIYPFICRVELSM
jgi:AraC-like DNA-binding protein